MLNDICRFISVRDGIDEAKQRAIESYMFKCTRHMFTDYLASVIHFITHKESYDTLSDLVGITQSRLHGAVNNVLYLIVKILSNKYLRFFSDSDRLEVSHVKGLNPRFSTLSNCVGRCSFLCAIMLRVIRWFTCAVYR